MEVRLYKADPVGLGPSAGLGMLGQSGLERRYRLAAVAPAVVHQDNGAGLGMAEQMIGDGLGSGPPSILGIDIP